MTHLDDENLSALLDGEAGASAAEMQAHVASCPECGKRLKRLQDASAAFRRSGAVPMPVGLAARAKAGAEAKKSSVRRKLGLVLAWYFAVVMVLFVTGIVLKKSMPSLFSQIQAMISGAATSMGSGPSK